MLDSNCQARSQTTWCGLDPAATTTTPGTTTTCAPLQAIACGPGLENEKVAGSAACPSVKCAPCKDGAFKSTTGTEACQAKLLELPCTQKTWHVFTAGSNPEKTTDDTRCVCKAKSDATKVSCAPGQTPVGETLGVCDGWGCEPCDAKTSFKPETGTQPCTLKRTACPEGEFFTLELSITTADETKCTPCPDGQFKTGTNGATVCAAKRTSCPAGNMDFYPGKSTQKIYDDGKCVCPDGMYSNVPDMFKATSCIAKRTGCPAGHWFQGSSNGIKDRDTTKCTACAGTSLCCLDARPVLIDGPLCW